MSTALQPDDRLASIKEHVEFVRAPVLLPNGHTVVLPVAGYVEDLDWCVREIERLRSKEGVTP